MAVPAALGVGPPVLGPGSLRGNRSRARRRGSQQPFVADVQCSAFSSSASRRDATVDGSLRASREKGRSAQRWTGGRDVKTGRYAMSNQSNGGRYRPPQRDTGITPEKDMAIELRDDAANGVNEDGSTWWRRSGEDRGEGGYRCRWTVMGGAARDGSWEYKETWWEKADWSGYKELGAEKSGFSPEGDTWWETWREVFRLSDPMSPNPGDAYLEKSADKWARNVEGWEWNEKWWERYTSGGHVEKGADKSGRQDKQAWWEKWGEQYDTRGGSVFKWTDKWAESGAGVRWGDKWEERFESSGKGTRQGETWRVSSTGDRWSRTWGESHGTQGGVRKYGRSTSGEQWDNISSSEPKYMWEKPMTWQEVLEVSQQLLAIETPPRNEGHSAN